MCVCVRLVDELKRRARVATAAFRVLTLIRSRRVFMQTRHGQQILLLYGMHDRILKAF